MIKYKSRYGWDWRSLVARTHGVREVRSSNLLSQTILWFPGCGAVGSAQRSGR